MLMRVDDVVKLVETFKAQNDHERVPQLRVRIRGGVGGRFRQGQVQAEQRRDHVVAKAPRASSESGTGIRFRQQLQKRLLGIEARGHEAGRLQPLAVRQLHLTDPAMPEVQPADAHAAPNLASVGFDVSHQAPSESSRAADAHLRLAGGRQQRRNRVAEALHAQIDFPQSVEEQKTCPEHVIGEVPRDELQGRKGRHFQQPAAQARPAQQAPPQRRFQGW